MPTRYADNFRRTLRVSGTLIATLAMGPILGRDASGQTPNTFPLVVTNGTPTRPVTPAEAEYQVHVKMAQVRAALPLRQDRYPKDSMLAVIAAEAERWGTRINSTDVRGMQLDPSGGVSVAASNERQARAQIARRLSAPSLLFADRAYTYLAAVRAFANPDRPAQLGMALEYLRGLDSLGRAAALQQFAARTAIVQAYYSLGQSEEVIRYGMQGIRLLPAIEYIDRTPAGMDYLMTQTVEAMTGRPDGRAMIDTVNKILLASFIAPPEMIALDSTFLKVQAYRQGRFGALVQVNKMLGNRGKPFIAKYWVNRPTRDSAEISVNDGHVHVVEILSYYCIPCLKALQGMERLHRQFPNARIMALTWTFGWWANRAVTSAEESRKLEEYFVNQAKVTFPVGIWNEARVRGEDGGSSVPGWPGPNNDNYPTVNKPMIWVIDGKGTIRRIFTGYSRDIHHELTRTIEFLLNEAKA
jgi:hypothetical protein